MSDVTKPQAEKPTFKPYDVKPIGGAVIHSMANENHHLEVLEALKAGRGESTGEGEPPEITPVTTTPGGTPPEQDEEEHGNEIRAGLAAGAPSTGQEVKEGEGQEEVQEVVAPPEPGEAQPQTPSARILAELTHAEGKLKTERDEFRAQQAEFHQKAQEWVAYVQQAEQRLKGLEKFEENIRTNPVGVLRAYGIDGNAFARQLLSGNAPDVVLEPKADPRDAQIAQLTQAVQHLSNQMSHIPVTKQADDYEAGILAALGNDDAKVLRSYRGDVKSDAMKYAAGYMQKFNVGPKDFTPAEAVARVRDEWEAHLKSIGAYDAVLQQLNVPPPTTKPKPQGQVNPKPTLTQSEAQGSPVGELEPDEPANHHNEVMRALKNVASAMR